MAEIESLMSELRAFYESIQENIKSFPVSLPHGKEGTQHRETRKISMNSDKKRTPRSHASFDRRMPSGQQMLHQPQGFNARGN